MTKKHSWRRLQRYTGMENRLLEQARARRRFCHLSCHRLSYANRGFEIVIGILAIFGVILFLSSNAFSQGFVIDHISVDLYAQIPDTYIAEVKKMWFNIPGESHSTGYRKGLSLLAGLEPKYAAVATEAAPPTPYREDALRVSGLNYSAEYGTWRNYLGEDAWYTNAAGITYVKAHIAYSNTHSLEIAAIGFGWCWDMTWHNDPGGTVDPVYGVRWAGSSVGGPEGDLRWGLDADDYALTGNSVNMDSYLTATQGYQDYCTTNGYPTKVVFTTGPVDGYEGESGYQRHLKHEHIRDYVSADSSRILFDYADILSWSDDGSQNLLTWNGHQYQVIHPDNMIDLDGGFAEDGDHIGEVGAVRLAKAIWVMMARLAGWDGGIAPQRTLTVTRSGTGTGLVTSSPAGINCGSTCTSQFTDTTVVTLTATSNADSFFAGWSGEGCSGTGTCTVTMSANRNVTATFTLNPVNRTLTVSRSGTGNGLVTSSPAGINCGSTCTSQVGSGTEIILTATATCGSLFTSWSGGPCDGSSINECSFIISEDLAIRAIFDHDPSYVDQHKLTVTRVKRNKGDGNIISEDGAIYCTPDPATRSCKTLYYENCLVTLSAEAIYPDVFLNWTKGCSDANPTCILTMDGAKNVKALFDGPRNLKVIIKSKRDGKGTVTSSSPGPGTRINCPGDCKEAYRRDEFITLTAEASPGSTFIEWQGGGCTGSSIPECSVLMDKAYKIKAIFTGP